MGSASGRCEVGLRRRSITIVRVSQCGAGKERLAARPQAYARDAAERAGASVTQSASG
jgi:hypothetical protein